MLTLRIVQPLEVMLLVILNHVQKPTWKGNVPFLAGWLGFGTRSAIGYPYNIFLLRKRQALLFCDECLVPDCQNTANMSERVIE